MWDFLGVPHIKSDQLENAFVPAPCRPDEVVFIDGNYQDMSSIGLPQQERQPGNACALRHDTRLLAR